jgi:hypothetical protein
MSDLRHYSNICLEDPRKTSGFCSQNLNINEDKTYVYMHTLYSYIFWKQKWQQFTGYWFGWMLHTDMPWLMQELCSRRSSITKIFHESKSARIWWTKHVYTRKSSWNPNSNTMAPDQLQCDPCCLCYHPALFFCLPYLTVFSWPHEKFSMFHKGYFFTF